MTAGAVPARRRNDAELVGRQVYYEQLMFWRNPFAAVFTVGFSVVFLILLSASGGGQRILFLHVKAVQYYVAAFAAYGVMSSCFNTLSISMVVRRETGLLKRLRLSPLPTSVMLAAVFLSALIVSVISVFLLLLVGKLGFGVHLPTSWAPFIIALVVGGLSFAAMGVAASTLVPNEEAAGPIISIVFFVLLFLSGLWFPLQPHSTLAQISKYFPVKHMIDAMFAPFHLVPGSSAWSWNDILVIALWGVAGAVIALRRWRWEPRRG